MNRITVICTRHEELDNCNAAQLLNIVEKIKPSIFFEELSQSNFDKSYIHNQLITVETDTIKRYSASNDIIHIPVDTFPRTRKHDKSVDQLYARIKGGITENAFQFRQNAKQIFELSSSRGFSFLNSDYHDNLFNEQYAYKAIILEELANDKLFELHRMEMEMIKNRENTILRNIYDYVTNSPFDEAVMFIGSGHRRTIFPLIAEFEKKEKTKIHWIKYSC